MVYDALAAWAKTFSAKDILFMQKNNLLQSFVFFLVVVNALSCLLNFAGKVMQLLYCIAVEHGTYCPDNWRLMMDYPLLGLSLEEVWSSRWHRILRPAWVASAFKPLYYIVRTWTNENPKYKQLAIGLASMAVFVVSGMTHEYVVLCNTGWELYKKTFIGDQMIFFCTHGILVVLEKAVKYIYTKVLHLPAMNSGIVRMVLHCYVIGVCYYFFHYFINGIAHWGLWRLDKITPVEDIVRHYLLDTPYLRSFCGSLLK
ncbi:uncharacterized protein EV154DRAFT_227002 [Mucor mucedo]|uniref:uncharacterized protein n=1 Tax=Mucor mucedo TaxID=29922 RepID=UPI00221EB4B3|nr:uncharacterized protein EV154DRAFT_227002 [Mucor mucedo]KAI7891323.1 hypothetical protein EV154DRAFT_227002 [Mucor mucedo]